MTTQAQTQAELFATTQVHAVGLTPEQEVAALDALIARTHADLDSFLAKRKAAFLRQRFPCTGCCETPQYADLTMIDVQYYVSPYSCSGGDYWTHSHYLLQCRCGQRFSLNKGSLFLTNVSLFKSKKECKQ